MAKADQVIGKIIKSVKVAVEALNENRLNVALELHKARHAINWRMTSYKFWSRFCDAEINLTMTTINRYVTAGAMIVKFGYSDAECKTIINSIGWTRFALGLVDSKRKLSAQGFIKKYKDHIFYEGQYTKSSNPFGDRAYTFSLPVDQADKLDGYLEHYGMTTGPKGGRRGVRNAFIDLVDIQLD